MDAIDKQILQLLQQDVTQSLQAIAEQVNLSTTPCWRRIQKLEQSGVIQAKVALLNRDKLNLGVTVFASVRTSHHSNRWLEEFKQLIAEIPEVVEAHRMSGAYDYLLHIVVPDIKAYDRVYKRLISCLEFTDVSSAFSMETMKATTLLPTDYV